MDSGLIERFFLDYLEHRGAAAEEVETGVWHVLSPSGSLEGAGSREELEVTFDPEAAAERAGRDLVTFGSPLLEASIAEVLEAGRVQHLHAAPRELDREAMSRKARSHFTFDRCRFAGLSEGREVEVRVLRLQGIVSVQADVLQQMLAVVHLDQASGRPIEHLRKEWGRLRLEERRQFVLPGRSPRTPEELLAAGLEEMQRSTRVRLSGILAEISRTARRERERIESYFGKMERELRERATRSRSEQGGTRQEQALAALQAEKGVRLREAEARGAARLEVRIVAADVLHLPWWEGELLVERGKETQRLPLRYDPLLGVLEPPLCPSCACPATTLVGSREGARLTCRSCTAPSNEDHAQASFEAGGPEPLEDAGRGPAEPERNPETGQALSPADPPVSPGPARGKERVSYRKVASDGVREGFSNLGVQWISIPVLIRTRSEDRSRVLGLREALGDALCARLLEAVDAACGGPHLAVKSSRRGTPPVGRGRCGFVTDLLGWPDQLEERMQTELLRLLSEALWAGRFPGRERVFGPLKLRETGWEARRFGDEWYQLRLLFCAVAISRGMELPVGRLELPARLEKALRSGLGLTGRGEDVWVPGGSTLPRALSQVGMEYDEAFHEARYIGSLDVPRLIVRLRKGL